MGATLSQEEGDLALALILAGSCEAAAKAWADGALYAEARLGESGLLDKALATRSTHLAANDIVLSVPADAWHAVAEILGRTAPSPSGRRVAVVTGRPPESDSATMRAAVRAGIAKRLDGAGLQAAASIISGRGRCQQGAPGGPRYRVRLERDGAAVTGIAEIHADPVQGWRTIGRSNRFRRGDAEARALRAAERQARSHAAAGGCADPSVEVLRPGAETTSEETERHLPGQRDPRG